LAGEADDEVAETAVRNQAERAEATDPKQILSLAKGAN